MKAIILAAGRGSRMKNLTDEIPKCMLEFRGKPLIEWQLASLRSAGINEIGIVTGSDMNYIRQQMPAVFQESNPFGSKLILLPCNGTKMYKFIKETQIAA